MAALSHALTVALDDELPDIVPMVGFGRAPPDSRMVFEVVGDLDTPVDE